MNARLPHSNARRVCAFLKHHGLDVDEKRLQHALPRVQRIVTKEKARPGLAFKVLLQEVDRQIDWRLAAELEENFSNN